MRLCLLIPATIATLAFSAPPAAAQVIGAVVSAHVTVIVPERRPARPAGERAAASRERVEQPGVSGQIDRPACAATLSLGSIGRASVSCLETAELGDVPNGVVLELAMESDPGASGAAARALHVRLDDGSVVRLQARPYARAGRTVYRVTAPTVAFLRIAHSPIISVAMDGRSHAMSRDDLAALRGLVPHLAGAGADAPLRQARR